MPKKDAKKVFQDENLHIADDIARMSNFASECFIEGAKMGAKTFEHILVFSGIAIGFLMTYWGIVIKDMEGIGIFDKVIIVLSLVLFLISAILSITRNYHGGYDLVYNGQIYFSKANRLISSRENLGEKFKKEDEEYLSKSEKKRSEYIEKRQFYSKFTKITFFLAIFLSTLGFISSLFSVEISISIM